MPTCTLLPHLEFLGDVLDDTLAALKATPPHALYKLDVALTAQKVSTKLQALERRLSQPLSAETRVELRALRELSGDHEPAPGQRECWQDEVLGRDLSKDAGRRD